MKVCCVIDSLHSGGAQRQMVWLVRSLVSQDHDVRLLIYREAYEHFFPDVLAVGVKPEIVSTRSKLGRFWGYRKAIRKDRPDAIISFLDSPNLIAIFSALMPNQIPVAVSERNFDVGGRSGKVSFRFNCFRLADQVVTNSYSQQDFVEANFPFLRQKLRTIVNCVDLEKFQPSEQKNESDEVRIIVGATIIERKNSHNLIRAIAKAKQRSDRTIRVHWYGDNRIQNGVPLPEAEYYLAAVKLLDQLGIHDRFEFLSPVQDMHNYLPRYDACCLPSFKEGTPNIVCEGMACGLPILASDFGENQKHVSSERGFLFDPRDPNDICEKILAFASLSLEQRQTMEAKNRRYAEEVFHPQVFSAKYQDLLESMVAEPDQKAS